MLYGTLVQNLGQPDCRLTKDQLKSDEDKRQSRYDRRSRHEEEHVWQRKYDHQRHETSFPQRGNQIAKRNALARALIEFPQDIGKLLCGCAFAKGRSGGQNVHSALT